MSLYLHTKNVHIGGQSCLWVSNMANYWFNVHYVQSFILVYLPPRNWITFFIFLCLQRNYPFFIMFISSSTLLCIYVFVFSWINLLRQGGNLWRAMSRDIVSVILIVYCFVAVWFVGGLTVFHVYLICTNQVDPFALVHICVLKIHLSIMGFFFCVYMESGLFPSHI